MEADFLRRRESVPAARRAIDVLDLGERRDDVRLIVTELVTNAVEHGQGDHFTLRLRTADGDLVGEVVDGGDGFDLPRESPDPARVGGRGLAIVRHLADAVGAYEGNSTHVWFSLKL